jgi:hypothetical protein
MNKLATTCVLSVGFFNAGSKVQLPYGSSVDVITDDGLAHQWQVINLEVNGKPMALPISVLKGSTEVMRHRLIQIVNELCDAYEEKS